MEEAVKVLTEARTYKPFPDASIEEDFLMSDFKVGDVVYSLPKYKQSVPNTVIIKSLPDTKRGIRLKLRTVHKNAEGRLVESVNEFGFGLSGYITYDQVVALHRTGIYNFKLENVLVYPVVRDLLRNPE